MRTLPGLVVGSIYVPLAPRPWACSLPVSFGQLGVLVSGFLNGLPSEGLRGRGLIGFSPAGSLICVTCCQWRMVSPWWARIRRRFARVCVRVRGPGRMSTRGPPAVGADPCRPRNRATYGIRRSTWLSQVILAVPLGGPEWSSTWGPRREVIRNQGGVGLGGAVGQLSNAVASGIRRSTSITVWALALLSDNCQMWWRPSNTPSAASGGGAPGGRRVAWAVA